MSSLIGGRRGRKDEQSGLDSIYGDFHITAPNGYPSKNADLYVRELDSGSHVDEESRPTRKEMTDGTKPITYPSVRPPSAVQTPVENGRDYSHSASGSLHVQAGAKHRSRSQSANSAERRREPDHRIRSSSSNRAGRSQEQPHHDKHEVEQEEVVFNLALLSGDCSPGAGIARPTAYRTISPVLIHGRASTPLTDSLVSHGRSGSLSDQRAAAHHSFSNIGSLNSVLERSHGPTVTVLSPVSEIFGADEADQSTQAVEPNTGAVFPSQDLFNRNDPISSPGSLTDVKNPYTSLPATTSAPKHEQHLINPLALHSTFPSRSHLNRQSSADSAHGGVVPQLSPIDKPLPAFPVGTTRSPPLECTSFMRASSRTGPGLGATSIMRPSSRNNHTSNPNHAPTSPVRSHQRSASLSHVGSVEPPSHGALTALYGRKGSYPEDSKPVGPARSQPSSAGSGLSSDTQSSQSYSYSPPRVDSPDAHPRSSANISPSTGLTYQRGSRDLSSHLAGQRSLATPSPAPNAGGMTYTNAVGGNIYNELRDDLRVVARDLNAISLAEERDKKLSKLRIRARSASRHDRRSQRPRDRDHDRERENDTQQYAVHHRHNDQGGGNRASANISAWGNTAFVPAYDMPTVRSTRREYADLKGQAEVVVPQTGQVEMVPDYDDLWC